jgi:ABC-type uncharacterized transport system substrate-binding protein
MFYRLTKVITLSCLLLTGSTATSPAWSVQDTANIAVIMDAKSSLHKQTLAGIQQQAATQDQHNLKFTILDINQPENARILRSDAFDYGIAIGVKPASFTREHLPAFPVLYSLVPQGTYNKLFPEADTTSAGDSYVIYLEQKPLRLLELARAITGDGSKIGVLAGNDSADQARQLALSASANNINLVVHSSKKENAADDYKTILRQTDIFIALYDSTILNRHNAKWLLYLAYKMKKPVIGFSQGYTDAGAIASIFSTPEQIGRQAVQWLLDMLAEREPERRQYPAHFTITTNPDIQRVLHFQGMSAEDLENAVSIAGQGGVDE